MKSEVVITREYVLRLSFAEAAWIRENVQNPLHGMALDSEPEADRYMREQLFKALSSSKRPAEEDME